MTDRVLWGIGTPRTFRAHWMLQELELDYETRPVRSRSGETRTPEFLRLDPRGKIPVLEDRGFVLSESAAIVSYLADTYGAGRALIPPPATRERARYDQWCYFVMTELDATSLYVIRRHGELAEVYGEAPAAIEAARAYFSRLVEVAAGALADRAGGLLEGRFTGADVLLVSCLDGAVFYGIALPPGLESYRLEMGRRPAYRRAFGINFPR
jgi:glutathione S-transferase